MRTAMYNKHMTYRQWLVGQFSDKLEAIASTTDRSRRDAAIERYLAFIDAIIDIENETALPVDDGTDDFLAAFGFGGPSAEAVEEATGATLDLLNATIPFEQLAGIQAHLLKMYGIDIDLVDRFKNYNE